MAYANSYLLRGMRVMSKPFSNKIHFNNFSLYLKSGSIFVDQICWFQSENSDYMQRKKDANWISIFSAFEYSNILETQAILLDVWHNHSIYVSLSHFRTLYSVFRHFLSQNICICKWALCPRYESTFPALSDIRYFTFVCIYLCKQAVYILQSVLKNSCSTERKTN